jgi:hypothetical protein
MFRESAGSSPPFSILRRLGMASFWDVGSVSYTGTVECGPVARDPEPPVDIPLGLRAVNPVDMGISLTSRIDLKTHTSIALSFSSGFAFESSVAALSGFDPGMDPLMGLTEGDFSCISSEPGALFDGDCWGTQQKCLLADDYCAQFFPSEIINDSSAFSEPAVTDDNFFGGVPSLSRVSSPTISPPCLVFKGIARGVDQLKEVRVANLLAHRGSQCA